MNTCLIALGSHQGDDALGWLVADAVAAALAREGRAITIHKTDRIGPEWLSDWQGCARVILVDALQGDAIPGTVCEYRLWPATDTGPTPGLRPLSTHAMDIQGLLDLAVALEQQPPELLLFGIEAAACTASTGLSEPVRHALPGLLARLQEVIQADSQPANVISHR